MTPSLSRTGVALVVVASAFLVAGAALGAWPLLALGFAQLSAVLTLYVLFIPHAALLRRRQLEFAWWVPAGDAAGGALLAGRKMKIELLFRNFSPFRFQNASFEVFCSDALALDEPEFRSTLPPRRQVRLSLEATPRAAGYWFLHGLKLRVSDRFGIFTMQVYFPNLLGIKVFPSIGSTRRPIVVRPRTGASHERVGPRLLRQRGLGTDLRELRDHVPGDPFKVIAWKATARTRKLVVREYDSEIVVDHALLLDISPSMRTDDLGQSKLDYGLTLLCGLARQALEAGDRVGLMTFDTRIYSQVEPKDGKPHLFHLIDRLMELHNIVDEDLTDLTDAELYSAVASFLAYQEGADVRVRRAPPRESPMWEDLVSGANRELIDRDVMNRAVRTSLKKSQGTGAPSWWRRVVATDEELALLRLFCRLRGVELPYRRSSPLASKSTGLAEAITEAAKSRASRFILVVSDLEDIDDPRPVIDALSLARRHRHDIVVVAPFGPDFLPTPSDAHEERVREILGMRHRRQREQIQKAISALGIRVMQAGPKDSVVHVLARINRIAPRRVA
ncbi:MAG: DUF58 domain-containing protein [Myxococcales bacterium]|nr:DUF58 domain-containing protein [Myxococcales bacterium]